MDRDSKLRLDTIIAIKILNEFQDGKILSNRNKLKVLVEKLGGKRGCKRGARGVQEGALRDWIQ